MPKLNIKLGHDMGEKSPTIAMPEKMYPTLHLDGAEKLDLPKNGTITLRYKKISNTDSQDSDGDEHYSCVLEIHEVVEAYSDEPEAPARSNRETEDALDKLRKNRKAKSDDY